MQQLHTIAASSLPRISGKKLLCYVSIKKFNRTQNGELCKPDTPRSVSEAAGEFPPNAEPNRWSNCSPHPTHPRSHQTQRWTPDGETCHPGNEKHANRKATSSSSHLVVILLNCPVYSSRILWSSSIHPPSDRHKHLNTPLHRSLLTQTICLG